MLIVCQRKVARSRVRHYDVLVSYNQLEVVKTIIHGGTFIPMGNTIKHDERSAIYRLNSLCYNQLVMQSYVNSTSTFLWGKKRVRNISLKTECDMETDMKHTTRVRLVTCRNGAQKSHDMYS